MSGMTRFLYQCGTVAQAAFVFIVLLVAAATILL